MKTKNTIKNLRAQLRFTVLAHDKDGSSVEIPSILRVVPGDRVTCPLAQMSLGLGRSDCERIFCPKSSGTVL